MKHKTGDELPGPHPVAVALVDALDRIHTELQRSRDAVTLRGAEPFGLLGSADTSVSRNAGTLLGWSIRETSGVNPATVVLRDGLDNTADPIAEIELPAGGTAQLWLGPQGVGFVYGLRAQLIIGAVEGAVWLNGRPA